MPTCARPLPRCASRRSNTPFGSTQFSTLDSRFRGNERSVVAAAASALRGAQPIETLLLLVAERCVKLLKRGLNGLHRAQHRIKPLLHRLQAADRRERAIGRTIRAQQIDRLGGGVLQLLEGAALRLAGPYGLFDPLQRQARDARCALAADLRQIALDLLLVRIFVGAERVEAGLLLVVERLIEL